MDDGGDASKSRSQVQELVEKHHAVAVVAALGLTQSRKAWQGYVEDKKVPVIGGTCTRGWNDSPMLFSQCSSFESATYASVHSGAKYGDGKKFGALFCSEDELCSQVEDLWFNKGWAKRAGLDPVYRARISITQPDFTSECIQARNAGVELFAVIGDPRTVERVASSCRRQNFTPQFLQGGTTVDASTPSRPGMENAIVMGLTFPFAGLSTPAFEEFDAAWKKYGGSKQPGASASSAWASVKIFEKAARAAGKTVSREALVKQLYDFKNERFGGLTIPLSYSTKGTADSPCYFLMKIQGGKWTAPKGDRLTCF